MLHGGKKRTNTHFNHQLFTTQLKKEDATLTSPTVPGNESTSPDGPVGATTHRYQQNKQNLYQKTGNFFLMFLVLGITTKKLVLVKYE